MTGTNDTDVGGDVPDVRSYWTAERRRQATPVPLPEPPDPPSGPGTEDAGATATDTGEPGREEEP